MTRWLWTLIAAVVLIAIAVHFWPASKQTTTPPTAQAPQTTAQTPAPAASADEGEQAADTVSRANEKAKSELASFRSGFGAKDLVAALNDSVVNFASGSAEVPSTMMAFLQKAADDLKQLSAGHVLEIAGYTDNTGNAEENVMLSQRRADAVRNALIKAGANPDMLVAKGDGGANPIAGNDTSEGRLRNRRIEYHIIKTP
jgi:outer membrane protein OmpA-like peptidoglycan-associated protein